jgi:putative addiction module killer protein
MRLRSTPEFDDWYAGIKDRRAQRRIDVRIDRLLYGNPGDHRNLAGDVSELRITEGKGYRVYYTIRGGALIILLCGGDKTSKARQQRDIALAQSLAANLPESL